MSLMSAPDTTPMVPCDGWWEEQGYGRQPMLELQLRVVEGQIIGSGWDIVGPFTFRGTISEGGAVAMIKQYLGQHQVEYLGNYDGEGTMFGDWRIGPFSDRWAITFKRLKGSRKAESEDVELLV